MTSSPGAANTSTSAGGVINLGELKDAVRHHERLADQSLARRQHDHRPTITAQGGTLGLNENLVTNGGGTTFNLVSGAIDKTSTGTSALPTLRTNNATGTLNLSQSIAGGHRLR